MRKGLKLNGEGGMYVCSQKYKNTKISGGACRDRINNKLIFPVVTLLLFEKPFTYLNDMRPVGGGKYGFRFGSLRPTPTGTDSAKSLGSSSMDSRRLPMSSVSLFSVCIIDGFGTHVRICSFYGEPQNNSELNEAA